MTPRPPLPSTCSRIAAKRFSACGLSLSRGTRSRGVENVEGELAKAEAPHALHRAQHGAIAEAGQIFGSDQREPLPARSSLSRLLDFSSHELGRLFHAGERVGTPFDAGPFGVESLVDFTADWVITCKLNEPVVKQKSWVGSKRSRASASGVAARASEAAR
jgi:hypothetical protein